MDCHWISVLILLAVVRITLTFTTTPSATANQQSPMSTIGITSTVSTSLISTSDVTSSKPDITQQSSTSTETSLTTDSKIPESTNASTTASPTLITHIIITAADLHANNTDANNTVHNTSIASSTSATLLTTVIVPLTSKDDNNITTNNFTITTENSVPTINTSSETTTTPSQTEPRSTATTVSSTTVANITDSDTTTVANITDSDTTTVAPTTVTTATTSYGPSVATTTVSPPPKVKISETNFLLTDPDSDTYFIELEALQNADVWLVILDASLANKSKTLLKNNYTTSMNNNGKFVIQVNNETEHWDTIRNVTSVLIALYVDEESADSLTMDGIYDFLLYSSHGAIDAGLSERFHTIENQKLIIDYRKLKSQAVSLSRCSDDGKANAAAVLTKQSPNKINVCNLTVSRTLGMKLTKDDQHCSFPDNFNRSLADNVISDVNTREQCGFAFHMLSDIKVNKLCNSKVKEIDVEFTVSSAFDDQLSLIMNGYQSFLTKTNLDIGGEVFDLHSCSENSCFATVSPATKPDDDRIRVTVAVVVSCIGVFLVVLLLVVLYLRRKKKGILQFHMSRLDEDDDLIGDMDDFVGNQGPTFRSFR